MRLFRRGLDLQRSTLRTAVEADLPRIARLFRDGAKRYYNFANLDLPALLVTGTCILIESHDDGDLWAALVAGWPVDGTAWLRGCALTDGLAFGPALQALVPALHTELRAVGVQRVYYGGDDGADSWMVPALTHRGYLHDTDVVVYEKRSMDMPATGNPRLRVRPAQAVDLTTVVAVDQDCFEAQWEKDDTILSTAMQQGPLFLVVEHENQVIGYAYATSHYGGRLVHLVRIAVRPQFQGLGAGVRLLAEVVAYARQLQAYTITLNTQAYNTRAQNLYRWFGFSLTGERQVILRYDM
ncbi:MAG: GNAT family N-acetyltransferase [Chloroflexaceae bacterium]|jgi:ribosomal protein S18 acetylase RimI-like enzyme|nr:GNAT family N-acetyltransferase [Chloroflexaceae bacterium]